MQFPICQYVFVVNVGLQDSVFIPVIKMHNLMLKLFGT